MRILTTLLLLIIFSSCNEKSKKENSERTQNMNDKGYVLEEDGGIYTEVFDSTNVDENRYTSNNRIYKENISFTYSFEHLTKEGEKLFFKEDAIKKESKYQWKFVKPNVEDKDIIEKVKISVKYGLEPMLTHVPDYNQTLLQYDYPTKDNTSPFNSISGAIENEKNVWIHPPRDKYFRILELNPFPFIKTPYEVGNSWEWKLGIGSGWGDERWKTWEGGIENQYSYEISGKKIIETKLGKIDCFIIKSTASSDIGKTKLTAYFNEDYGFIRLNYTNIDGSKTNLELIEYSDKKTT